MIDAGKASLGLRLRHLRAFAAVAEARHFGRAAAALGLTQPALSRTVAELEALLGVALLRRTSRSVEPTPAGSVFLGECRALLDRLEAAVRRAQRAAAGAIGRVRIGYMDFAINGRLPELVRGFREREPEVAIELVHVSTDRQEEAFAADAIDLGFRIGAATRPDIGSRRIESQRLLAVLPRGHALARRRRVRLGDLAAEPLVIGSEPDWSGFRRVVWREFALLGITPRIVQEASSSDGVFGLVAAGAGVSLYGDSARTVPYRGVVLRELEGTQAPIDIHASWREGVAEPTVDRFLDYIFQEPSTEWSTTPSGGRPR